MSLKHLVAKLKNTEEFKTSIAKKKETRHAGQKVSAKQFTTHLFAYRAVQTVVQKMLKDLESCLIQDREPLQRAQDVLSQLLNHPDIKVVLGSIAAPHACWQIDKKKIAVVDILLRNLREAISVCFHDVMS